MTQAQYAARAALRARQGDGARYDAVEAPADLLLLARRGTASFARRLNDTPDEAFGLPTAREGWSRAMMVAYVGLHARKLAGNIEKHRRGRTDTPDIALTEAELIRARSLSPRALRHLFHHSAKHLDVEWRDLSDAEWLDRLFDSQTAIAETPVLRAAVVWHGAALLSPGGQFLDLPRQVASLRPFAIG
jgi:maleylpyruvate isomerase